MSIDVLSLRHFRPDENAIDVAFPVFAVECEVSPPLEYQLDIYEETALKCVSLGLSAPGIAKTLNITLSLVEQILSKLDCEKYIIKHSGRPWELTEDGQKYLSGIRENRPSGTGRFGYMFVSAIKKDILQYFYDGSVGKIPRSDGRVVANKLLIGDENSTFCYAGTPKRWRLEEAYSCYLRNLRLGRKLEDAEMTRKEARNAYADFESFDEADYEDDDSHNQVEEKPNMESVEVENGREPFVRPLKRPMEKLYLQMRIIISPENPGGFIVESPLELNGIDDEFFLRQVQWMKNAEEVKLRNMSLNKFLEKEIQKLSKQKPLGEKDKSVFILEKMPLLFAEKHRYFKIYADVGDIYGLMGANLSQIARENIVGAFNRKLLEALMNRLLRTAKRETLRLIKANALSDMKAAGIETIVVNIARTAKINRDVLSDDVGFIKSSIYKMDGTLGNSIAEKMNNILTVYTYGASEEIRSFVEQPGLDDYVNTIMRLNKIRNPVSHDTDRVINQDDYEFYLAHVFDISNRLLESIKEGNKNGKKAQGEQ